MKVTLCFIFLASYLSCCVGVRRADEHYWLGTSHEDYSHHHDSHIERPCHVRDVNCIRRYFAHHICSLVHEPVADPYILKNLVIPLPYCNITLTLVDAHVRGINHGKILEFYINKKTDTVVLEVGYQSLVVETPETVVTYHLKGKEAAELTDETYIDFRRFSITLNIRNFGDIHRAKSYVGTHFNATPHLKLGKNIAGTKDPTLMRMNRKWMDDILLGLKEGFVVQGPLYMSAFINNNICDFRHE